MTYKLLILGKHQEIENKMKKKRLTIKNSYNSPYFIVKIIIPQGARTFITETCARENNRKKSSAIDYEFEKPIQSFICVVGGCL